MKIVTERYVCQFCDAEFDTDEKLQRHELAHDIVYIGMERQEWKQLALALLYAAQSGAPIPEKSLRTILSHKLGVKV